MKNSQSLYLIGILPPSEIAAKVIDLKQYFASNFSSPKGLSVLPHITLQMPFRLDVSIETLVVNKLANFASNQSSFIISVNGFGFFSTRKSYVTYIHIEENPTLKNLHYELMNYLRDELAFSEQAAPFRFKPHMTIAYRDLSKEQFKKSWPEFEHAEFNGKWNCNSFHLLKHDGKQWKTFKEFEFL